ncbi:MAG: DHH family phosphoesterase [Bacilli bacterium]|nr:DHH family phosphoesterase [Bacilli bacterium]
MRKITAVFLTTLLFILFFVSICLIVLKFSPSIIIFNVLSLLFVFAFWLLEFYAHKFFLEEDKKIVNSVINKCQRTIYNFCGIGLILIDDDNKIIWFNDVFNELAGNGRIFLNQNIFIFCDKLQNPFSNSRKEYEIDLFNKFYRTEYLADIKLFIFYDVNNIKKAETKINNNRLVIGIIIIDNYYTTVLDSNLNDINSSYYKIRNSLLDYAKKKNILINQIRDDAYLFLCNFLTYSQNLLDDVENNNLFISQKERFENSNNTITISVGISFNCDNINQLYKLANEAVVCAIERGGNQIVVYEHGKDMVFFGRSDYQAYENNSNNLLNFVEKLIGTIKKSNIVFVVGHVNGDVDSLASCLGIYAICKNYKKKCFIFCDIATLEEKAKKILKDFLSLESKNVFLNKDDLGNHDEINKKENLLIIVDHNFLEISEIKDVYQDYFNKCSVIIIDHHRHQNKKLDTAIYHIDVYASSTSEIISEIIRVSDINITAKISTLLLSGILFDSGFFRSSRTNFSTFQVASFLINKRHANKIEAFNLLKDNFDEVKQIMQFVSNNIIEICDGISCCLLNNGTCEKGFLAKIANNMVQIQNIKVAFVLGKVSDNSIYVSCRSDGKTNVQIIAEKLGGGGHLDAAAFSMTNKTIYEVVEQLFHVLEIELKQSILCCPVCFHKLVKQSNYNKKNAFFVCDNTDNCRYITYCDNDDIKQDKEIKKYTTFENFRSDAFFSTDDVLFNWFEEHAYLETKKQK